MAIPEGSARKGYLFRLQLNERVEISLVDVYERVEKSVISVCKETKSRLLTVALYGCEKVKKPACIMIHSYFINSAF